MVIKFRDFPDMFEEFECVSSGFGVLPSRRHSSEKPLHPHRSSGPIRNNGSDKNCSISPHLSDGDSGGNIAPI